MGGLQVIGGECLRELRGQRAVDELAKQAGVEGQATHCGAQAGAGVEAIDRAEAGLQGVVFRCGCCRRGNHRFAPCVARWQPVQQGAVELFGVDRLGDVIVHAGAQAGLAILVEGIGGHREDWRAGVAGQAADQAGGGEAVEHRHLHVHQDQVVGGRARFVDGDLAVVGDVDCQANAGE